ncbi:conjugal transfer protein TraD [Sphingopyxis sp. YF1]|uniref:conjugal transfer protein TraD n=1 Tax=Sphingopyxis sp. YF1 TaxID=2482763 RepID=UPI001F607527|nr:conjugal transfer protein TraD [Sphingopyxis sp. YF1]UNU45134.1 conjugal transfer protein TraD [Sphingopyxis sp. YF1]
MRRPRNFDAELQALTAKAKALKTKKQGQLGELIIAIGADALTIEQLAGALLEAVGADAARKEAWRKSGAAFFRGDSARARKDAGRNAGGASASGAGQQPSSSAAGAT